MTGGSEIYVMTGQHFPIEKTNIFGWSFLDFPKVHTKLGKVKNFQLNLIKNEACNSDFMVGGAFNE